MYQNEEKPETLKLYWQARDTGELKDHAGVGFYNSKRGDYTLKIDCLPGFIFYLKPKRTENQTIYYRLESSSREHGVRHGCAKGYGGPDTQFNVVIDNPCWHSLLVLILDNKQERNVA